MKQFLSRFFDIKFWKFLLVGVINTLVGSCLTFGLYNFTPLGYWASSAISYALSSIVSFILNRKFTFAHKGPAASTAVRFALNIAVCYVLAYSIAKPLVTVALSAAQLSVKLVENIALLAGMIIFTGFNYIGQRYFAFRSDRSGESSLSAKKYSVTDILKMIFFATMTFAGCWIVFGGLGGVAAAICFCGFALICYKVDIPKFSFVIFALAFITRLILVLLIKTPPVSDFGLLLDASQKFAAGDFSFKDTIYFQMWPGQTGQVIFQGFLLKIWNSVFFLKLINCLAAAGIDVLIYLTARNFFSEKASQTAAVLYCFSAFPATLATVLTNQHVSAFLTYLAVFLLVAKRFSGMKCYVKYPLAAVLLVFSNMIRPDVLVIIVAVAVYCVFGIFSRLSAENLKKYGSRLLLFVGSYVLVGNLLSGAVALGGVNDSGLSNQNYLLKFVYGLNQESGGTYSESANRRIDEYIASGMERNEAEKILIEEEIKALAEKPENIVTLLDSKVKTVWAGEGIYWSLFHLLEEDYEKYYSLYLNVHGYELFCSWSSVVLALIGFCYSRLKNRRDLKRLIIPFIIFATFFIYLIIEVQSRYVYCAQISVYIMAAGGIEAFYEIFGIVKKHFNSNSDDRAVDKAAGKSAA